MSENLELGPPSIQDDGDTGGELTRVSTRLELSVMASACARVGG